MEKKGVPGWVWALVAVGALLILVPLCLVGAGAVTAMFAVRGAQQEVEQQRAVANEELQQREREAAAQREAAARARAAAAQEEEAARNAAEERARAAAAGQNTPPLPTRPGERDPDPLRGLEGL